MSPRSTKKNSEAEKRIEEALRERSLSLDLSELGLTQLPTSLSQLIQLQYLDLDHNQLTTLPDSLGQLSQLQRLKLTKNQLTTLPDSLGRLSQLQQLWLSRNQLTMLPDSLGQLSQLQDLDLSGNQLTTLPNSLGQLSQLQTLFLSGNQLTTLPDSLGQLSQLQNFTLGHNRLTTLPDSLGQLSQLWNLDLDHNQLTTLPDSLGQLSQLWNLYLSHNQLTTLPDSLGQLSQLRNLFLSDNQLTTLPDSLGQLSQLQDLNLSGNQLTTLPNSLGQLSQLQTLSLHDNRLTTLSDSLGQLSQLKTLFLSGNQFTTLPDSLGQLSQLQTLFLSGNQFTTLPDSLGQLSQLFRLDLSGNQLTTLPDWLRQLSQLRMLYLSDNQLTTLPDWLGQLSQLQTLFLSDNQLTTLPETIQRLRSLGRLFLHGNPALCIPRSILGPESDAVRDKDKRASSPNAILDYYFGQKQTGRPLNEMKLLLVGRGGTGKTSLARALQGHSFSQRLKETKGVTITPWTLKAGKDRVKVHTWDFAGQVITHAAHQFFFTQQSLYILVLTGRENSERTDAEYWLRLIQAFGTDRASGDMSPVIVALNKAKSHPCHVDRNALREKYPFIVDFVDTDCKTGTGISTLKRMVEKTATRLPAVRLPFPSAWWAIKEALEKKDRDHLSYSDYRTLSARLGEPNESKQDSLAVILHALGVALNYADDVRLRDTTILNPHWVTNGMYALLRDATRDDGTGELHLKDVRRVLSKETPAMQRYMVELMRRFELAFPLNEAGDRWLVAQRLAEQQPKLSAEWQGSDVTRLRYHYTTLPEGLLPRFITRTYPLSDGQPRWVNGVILEENGCRALVRADQAERLVTVAVRGEPAERRRLLGLIRADFQKIHSDIEGLNPKEEIELSDKPGTFVDLHVLQLDEQNKQPSSAATSVGTVSVNPSTELNRVSAPAARDPHQWKAKLFISYSSKDAKQHDELLQRLKPLISEGLVITWSDRCLVVGQEWDKIIRSGLKEADVIIFLVSAAFEASSYIQDIEVDCAVERAENKEAVLASIILEKCQWERSRLAKYQVLPPKGHPVRDTKPQRNAWHAVAEGLRMALETLRDTRSTATGFEPTFLSPYTARLGSRDRTSL
jgi:internalin A